MRNEKDKQLKQYVKQIKSQEAKVWRGFRAQQYGIRSLPVEQAKSEILELLSPEAEAKWKASDHDFDPYDSGFSPYDISMALHTRLGTAVEALLELEKEGKIKPISDDILAGASMPQIVIELI